VEAEEPKTNAGRRGVNHGELQADDWRRWRAATAQKRAMEPRWSMASRCTPTRPRRRRRRISGGDGGCCSSSMAARRTPRLKLPFLPSLPTIRAEWWWLGQAPTGGDGVRLVCLWIWRRGGGGGVGGWFHCFLRSPGASSFCYRYPVRAAL
jgi:hypothetical protein